MDWYPKNLYADVREEETDSTFITIKKKQLDNLRIRKNHGRYIRVFDGEKWFSSSSSDNAPIQEKVDSLSQLATKNQFILTHPRIKAIRSVQESKLVFQDNQLNRYSIEDKLTILHQFDAILSQEPLLTDWTLIYTAGKSWPRSPPRSARTRLSAISAIWTAFCASAPLP